MKKLIRKILKNSMDIIGESSIWDENEQLNLPLKVLKYIDSVGIEKAYLDIHTENDSWNQYDFIISYYKDYNGKWSEDIPVKFDASEIASFFEDRDYNLEKIVEDYLSGNYEYDGYYDCYDYDHNWMWEDINEENQNYILEKAKEDGIDMENDDAVEEFIKETYGSDIGCAFADAQHDADINALHEDIMSEVESLLSEFNGKWNFDSGKFNGTIPFIKLIDSEWLETAIDDIYEDSFDIIEIKEFIIEKEIIESKYGPTVLFPYEPSINTDRHFRYGGAGDMNKDYMNEILSDKLSWN